MGVIHCCGGLRRTKTFLLKPYENFFEVRMDWLESCPCCSHTVLQLTRIDYNNEISIVRKINEKARKLKEKLNDYIIMQVKENLLPANYSRDSFYLYYNEYGKKKKCFSNLSQLKIGLYENNNDEHMKFLKERISFT